ncbi:MAG: cation-translocating P-type ATPase [Rhodocyclaceae bacterium]
MQHADAVGRHFKVNMRAGLTSGEVDTRLAHAGPNVIREKPRMPAWRVFLDQFANFMIVVLLAAAVVSSVVGDMKDAIAILVIVVLNAIIGFAQTMRAEQAMAALKRMAGTSAQVLRDGQIVQTSSADVVPGDILLLEAGQVVSADVRLFEVAQLKVDESALTGEAVPVDKATSALDNAQLPLGDRDNMAFKGTVVTYGRGTGIVVATGMDSELGKVAGLLDSAEEPATPLQKRLAVFGQRLAMAILGICAIFVITGLLRGEPIMLVLLTGISLAVAAIPEALPAVVTISLALGARKMVRQNALIRRLPAVETLGSVTYICSDKTGTLTQNRMQAAELRTMSGSISDTRSVPADAPWPALMTGLSLCNDASRHADGNVIGDPTEVALFNAALDAGYDKTSLSAHAPRIFELPFDSERKRMTTFHRGASGIVAYTKGAPESVLPRCHAAHGLSKGSTFDPDAVLVTAEQMAANGMRVLALAQRLWDALPDPDAIAVERIESALEFTGLVGLIDPARAEAREAIALCRSAGIRPVMITGDHPATAQAIARQIGMTDNADSVMTGAQLAAIDDEAFARSVTDIGVYARVDPAQKIRIVRALQADGEFVAMTGDGVNDAPALKRADIGVAMGKGGTDVAREAASLILLDDNFATIVKAVREGRRIFDNIRKFIRYAMTGNSAEILTLFLAPFLGLPIPLLPIHLLWINLLTDGLPGLALAVEPAEKGTMQRPPRPPNESIFAHGMWQSVVVMGSLTAALCLSVQAWAIHVGDAHWQTMVFTQLTLSQLALVMAIRVEWDSVFAQGVFRNRALLGAVLLSFLLQLATIYIPFLNPIFSTAPLNMAELSLCVGLSALVFLLAELEKLLMRHGLLFYARKDVRPHQQLS